MKRQFDAACRQYEVKAAAGDGRAAWPDGVKSSFPSVKLLGRTEQQSYTGKNLWTTDAADLDGNIRQSLKYDKETQTYTADVGFDSYVAFIYTFPTPIPAGVPVSITVFLESGKASANYILGGYHSVTGETTSWQGYIEIPGGVDNSGKVYTSSVVTTATVTHFVLFANAGIEILETMKYRVMFMIGDTPSTVFEPYVGGTPSPNPLYPQEVKANNATVRSRGKNLFHFSGVGFYPDSTTVLTEIGADYFVIAPDYDYLEEYPDSLFIFAAHTTAPLKDFAPDLVAGRKYFLRFDSISSIKYIHFVGDGLSISNWNWDSGKSMVMTEAHLNATITFYGAARSIDGDIACRISNIQIEEDEAATDYEPYFDGGEATAPHLMCAVDGSCQSTYDPQTGEYVDWWWPKITLDGSEYWLCHPNEKVFSCWEPLPEPMYRNAYWCNQCLPGIKGPISGDGMRLALGSNQKAIYVNNCPFFDETLEDNGLANWKAHLAQHPLEVWAARNEPEVTDIGANRLTCPTGGGQIIQTAGDIENCPLEVKYLAHGGNVK